MYEVPRRAVEDVRSAVIPFSGTEVLAACAKYAQTDEGSLALLFLCAEYFWRAGRSAC